MYLYVFRARAKAPGRLLDLSGADLLAATQAITTRSGDVRVKIPSGSYVIMACLQCSNWTGAFHLTVQTGLGLRPRLQELPLLISRIYKPCSNPAEGGTTPIVVQIPPRQRARIDLIAHRSCKAARLRAEVPGSPKLLQLRSIERQDNRGRFLVENDDDHVHELHLYAGDTGSSSSSSGHLEIMVISSYDCGNRARIIPR